MPNLNWDLTKYLQPHLWRQDEPNSSTPIKYDPKFGFENVERPERKVSATLEEMESCHLNPHFRNQCAHVHIMLQGCLRNNPFLGWPRCKGLRKELEHCYQEELFHDMKEFEREKRLNARERRIAEGNLKN